MKTNSSMDMEDFADTYFPLALSPCYIGVLALSVELSQNSTGLYILWGRYQWTDKDKSTRVASNNVNKWWLTTPPSRSLSRWSISIW